MELRVLRYFLITAREENITHAAQLLHISQPALSRQLMQLEEELGVQLFKRSKYRIILTEDGLLLRRRAQEIVELADRASAELRSREELSGEIAIGCGETNTMSLLSEQIAAFRSENPLIRFSIYSATADDIMERLDRGLLDIGLLSEPVDTGHCGFIRLPREDVWGVLVRRDSPLAAKDGVSPAELLGIPLLLGRRREVIDELAAWFGDCWERVEPAGSFNLVLNAANMVLHGVGAALCIYLADISDELRFVPLRPELRTGAVLVWKRGEAAPRAASAFLEQLKNNLNA